MSSSDPRHNPGDTHQPHDPVEDIISAVPIVLPVAGGVLMFLLAFIAVYMT